MKKVQVLMSTYNGEEYLREQIDSILLQKGVEVHLLVRDDGSEDNTVNILREYESIEVIKGENVGVCRSFFELINKSGIFPYYSFADQDDVWDEDKLLVATSALDANCDVPVVYASNTRLVDADLNFLINEEDNPKTTLGSAFIKNYCTGCTMVFNDKLMSFLKNHQSDYVPMHDWWVNLVCLSLGGISYYDVSPHMNYRQHSRNVLGAESNFMTKAKNRWKKFLYKPYQRDVMAKELLTIYGNDITDENILILKSLSNPNVHLLFETKIKTADLVTNILFGICVIAKKI